MFWLILINCRLQSTHNISCYLSLIGGAIALILSPLDTHALHTRWDFVVCIKKVSFIIVKATRWRSIEKHWVRRKRKENERAPNQFRPMLTSSQGIPANMFNLSDIFHLSHGIIIQHLLNILLHPQMIGGKCDVKCENEIRFGVKPSLEWCC